MAKSSALMSCNVFTFPNEAQMQLHIEVWEVHGPLMFEKMKENGCLACSCNQVWNSPGTFKTSAMYEYGPCMNMKAPRPSRPASR